MLHHFPTNTHLVVVTPIFYFYHPSFHCRMQPTEVNHRRFCQKVQGYCISWANFRCLLQQNKPGEVKGRSVRTNVSMGKVVGCRLVLSWLLELSLWRKAKRRLPNKHLLDAVAEFWQCRVVLFFWSTCKSLLSTCRSSTRNIPLYPSLRGGLSS